MSDILVPIAVSSQLDVTGEERIHAAKYTYTARPNYIAPPQSTYLVSTQGANGTTLPSFWKIVDGTSALVQITGDNPVGAAMPAMSADSTYCAYGLSIVPYIRLYKRSGDTYSEITNAFDSTPPNVLNQSFRSVSISDDGTYVAMWSEYSANKLYIYKRTGDAFTLQATPATVPLKINATNGDSTAMSWSPSGAYLAVIQRTQGTGQAQSIFIYKNTAGTLTLLAQPNVQLASVYAANKPAWSPSEDMVVFPWATQADLNTNCKVAVYKRSGDVFTQQTTLTKSARSATAAAFSSAGDQLAVGTWGGPGVLVYSRAANVFTEVSTTLANDLNITGSVSYTKDGSLLLAGSGLEFRVIAVPAYTVVSTSATPNLSFTGHPV